MLLEVDEDTVLEEFMNTIYAYTHEYSSTLYNLFEVYYKKLIANGDLDGQEWDSIASIVAEDYGFAQVFRNIQDCKIETGPDFDDFDVKATLDTGEVLYIHRWW